MLPDTQAVNVYYRRYLREKMCFTYPSESILEGNVGNKLPHFGSWSLDRCNLFFVSGFASIHCWCLLSEVYERRGGWGLCVCCLHSDFHLPSLNNLTMMREHTESIAILQSTALCQRGARRKLPTSPRPRCMHVGSSGTMQRCCTSLFFWFLELSKTHKAKVTVTFP